MLLCLATPVSAVGLQRPIVDLPGRRIEAFYEQRAFPFGRIEPGVLLRALEGLGERRAAPWAVAPIRGDRWEALGPERIPWFLESAGRIRAVALHPSAPGTMYVGGAQGGVWKTTDHGASWTALSDDACSLAVGAIAVDPVDPEIVYAGTGEHPNSGGSYYSCGLLRSVDGGATWTRTPSTVFDGMAVTDIVIDPRTSGAVSSTTLVASSTAGVFRSTNGGDSWVQVLGISYDLEIHPTDPAVIFAGVFRDGVYRSEDGGVTWTRLSAGLPAPDPALRSVKVAVSASNPDVVYASLATGTDLVGVWRSDDGGDSWTERDATLASCSPQCSWNMVVAVSPADPNTVFFGGVQLFKSTDGAASFVDVTGPIHVDQHAIVFDPADPGTVVVANDGGVYRSRDDGATWASINADLQLTQFYTGVSLHPWDPAVMLGGTRDNGTVLANGGVRNWSLVLSGDGGFTAFDRSDPIVRYAEVQWIRNSSFSGPRRSDGGPFVLKRNGISPSDDAVFTPPLVMDPTTASTLYFGTSRVYRSTDRAESWAPISPYRERVTAIAPAASDPDVLYLGSADGGVHVTEDGGGSWRDVSSGLPTRWPTDIAVHPTDPRTVYVTFSGFGSGHLYGSTDAGATWSDLSASLADVPANAILIDPAAPSTILVGTDLGVWISEDAGASWNALNAGLPNASVLDIAYESSTGTLVAATHGRGMFSLALDRPLTLAARPGSRSGTAVAGSDEARPDSGTVVLTGAGSSTASWSASHGPAPWLTLTTAEGVGPGRVRWARTAAGLAEGVYVDTITVAAAGADGSPALIVDTIVAVAPEVSLDCASDHLLGVDCLDAGRQRYLDTVGNGDGTYNLGDFLALLSSLAAAGGEGGR